MARKKFGEYYLGLDIGTDSVGWAATDPGYNLLTLNQKSMWGSRLFPEAQTAVDRRTFRIARRRIQRRNQRLALLQDIFSEEVCKIDPDFFMRLQEGMLHAEDKTKKDKNNLFASGDFDDKAYHKQYPTIYHLRSELIHSKKPHDVRLVYLALHHIIKYRGHFLFEGNINTDSSFNDIIGTFFTEVSDALEIPFECSDSDEMAKTLCDRDMNRTNKQKRLFTLFDCKQNTPGGALLKAITGAPVSLKSIFSIAAESEEEIKVEFGNENYEELQPKIEALLGDDYYILEKARAIHDWALLEAILHEEAYLSDAKIKLYEQHAKDLKLLKKIIRKYKPEAYFKVFQDPSCANNYCAYAGVAKIKGHKAVVEKRCTQADFGKFIQNLLKDIQTEDKELQAIREKIAAETFMPKLRTKDNSVVPNQIHLKELEAILSNAATYLPFLKQKDADGITPAEKIRQILTFRIPYYVGPLNSNDPNAKNTWVARRSNEKIYPWNFDEIVDRELSASRFITRMTAQCTYLTDQPVLPQNSLLYSRFAVLNELNNLKINGEPISVELKQNIFTDCFMTRKKVSMTCLLKYLQSNGYKADKEDITGIDGEFHNSFGIWLDMHELLGDEFREDVAEEIIRLSTVLGDDRKMFFQTLKKEFGNALNEQTIKAASAKRYRGWGRLSGMFLTGIHDNRYDPATGEYPSIITSLWETNEDLMQLLSREHGFADAVAEYNRKNDQQTGFVYDTVKDLYLSPSIKRSVWQTLSIVKEIRKITGHDPKKVFIEMARGGGEKNRRTESRKNKLLALYRFCKDDTRNWIEEIGARDDSAYRSDRLYLYYTQMGKCMYTGEPIDLDKIYDQTVYDVDHIFPQSKVKDDSLDNRVLVKRVANAKKTDIYPISKEIRDKMHAFWSMLLKKDLISKKKYERLTRATPLTDEELTAFVSRQLVETRQGTKAVAEILQTLLPETDIVYVKAGLVSDFRHDYDMLKCREVNDLHHGKDAYLNIVVGNVYNTKFTKDPRNFFGQPNHEYSINRMFDFEVKRGTCLAWTPGEAGSICTVKRMMRRNNVLVTRMTFDQKGKLFDTMLVRKGEWQLPIKQSHDYFNDQKKYGGYNKLAGAHFMLVEHTVKGERKRSLIDMPLYMAGIDPNGQKIKQMLITIKELADPQIIIPHIGFASVIEVDGFRMYLTGRTGNNLVYAPGHQLIIGYQNEKYLRQVLKTCERAAEHTRLHKEEMPISEFDQVNDNQNLALYDLFAYKLKKTIYNVRLSSQVEKLAKARSKFAKMTIIQQCLILKQLLNLFTCNRSTADLKILDLGGQAGVISTSRTMTGYHSAKLISQSITGLFETERDLLK